MWPHVVWERINCVWEGFTFEAPNRWIQAEKTIILFTQLSSLLCLINKTKYLKAEHKRSCSTSSLPETFTTTGKPLWLVDVLLRVSTMVPTFSILFKQVTGELITSLDGGDRGRKCEEGEGQWGRWRDKSKLGGSQSEWLSLKRHQIRQDLTWQWASVRWQEPPSAGREHSAAWCGCRTDPEAERDRLQKLHVSQSILHTDCTDYGQESPVFVYLSIYSFIYFD